MVSVRMQCMAILPIKTASRPQKVSKVVELKDCATD
jgi:hypothetical protein